MEIHAGVNLGRYQLLAEIGRGAMGTVFQALDPEIDRLVALKVFSAFDSNSFEGQTFRQRFAQEARAAGRLMHPGIVAIYDRGEEPTSRTPYIVMEYIAGQPLSRLLSASSGRLEERFSLQVAREVAEALGYAHEKGVVHRDIKPSNILISEEGNAKIADFGVARLDTSDMTIHGQVLGTPAFMSPEQLTGGGVDGRSDLFSLGVILYTMLIGFRPFQGNGASTIGFKVVNQEPMPITSFHLDLSKDTQYVVARAMAKNPADRYATGADFAQDLTDILEGRQPRSRKDAAATRVSPEVFGVLKDYRPFLAALTPRSASPQPRPTSHGSTSGVAAAGALAGTPSLPPPAVVPSRAGRPVSVTALVAFAAVAAVAGVYVNHSQQVALHTADAKLGRPPAVSERIAVPAISEASREPVIEVSLPVAKPPAREAKETEPNLDYTVIRNAPRPAPAVVAIAAPAPVKPTPAPAWSDPLLAHQPVSLEFSLQHHFIEAEVWVWVDNSLVFTGTAHGESKKKLLVLHGGIEGKEFHEIRFPGGEHEVKVRVSSKTDQYDESGTIRSTFLESQRPVLDIRCNKKGIELKLSNGS